MTAGVAIARAVGADVLDVDGGSYSATALATIGASPALARELIDLLAKAQEGILSYSPVRASLPGPEVFISARVVPLSDARLAFIGRDPTPSLGHSGDDPEPQPPALTKTSSWRALARTSTKLGLD